MEAVETIEKVKTMFYKTLEGFKNQFAHTLIQERINQAALRFEAYEVPNKKQEDWKYSNIGQWLKKQYKVERSNNNFDIGLYKLPGLEANTLIFVNGFFRNDLSDIQFSQKGVIIQNLTESHDLFEKDIESHFDQHVEHNFFNDLNTLYHGNGLFIKVEDNTISENMVHIIHIQTGTEVIAQPRNLIIIGKNSKLDVIESQVEVNAENCLTNQVSEFVIGENAQLNYVLSQKGENNGLIHTNRFVQKNDSRLISNIFTLKKAFIRNNHKVSIEGKGTETHLNGTFMPDSGEQVDNHTLLDHQNTNGYSDEMYKGILFKDSSAIFNGKIYVAQAAQKTNAFLNNANILLDDRAVMDSKPELEIYADDVKCSHGSATGDLDTEALFYLQSRGIGLDAARGLLVHAFLGEVLNRVPNEFIRNAMSEQLEDRLLEME
jgi:Fe-S cluster assembly protein SufD